MDNGINIDWERQSRTGVAEAVFAERKTNDALLDILNQAVARNHPLLFTRINADQAQHLLANTEAQLDFDELSNTLIYGQRNQSICDQSVGIVAAGTSDMAVASEVQRTLAFCGVTNQVYADVGVAGLWRLTSIQDELQAHRLIIAVAGMEGALFSVLAGLITAPLIAVPTSVGYGVSAGGHTALHSALGSCSPGIVSVNIDNGFGAAAAAVKFLR